MKLPNAKTTEIVVQKLDKELLVYDLLTNKAYVLNETSMAVFEACGNNQTFEDLKNKYKLTDDLIYLTLDILKSNNLIVDYKSEHFAGLSRREVIRRVGLTSMIALPVISGLVAPSTANAASVNCVAPGDTGFVTTATTCDKFYCDDICCNHNAANYSCYSNYIACIC